MTTRSTTALLLATFLAFGCGDEGKDKDTENPTGCEDADLMVVFSDLDGDGFGDPSTQSEACEMLDGLVDNGDDCNDDSDAVYPGATEACDGLDNNCDVQIDEGLSLSTFYTDADGDGHGDPNGSTTTACVAPPGYAPNTPDDCDDDNGDNFPGNDEICDGVDNDCDNKVDDQDASLIPDGQSTYYADNDGDTFGDPDNARDACTQPNGYVTNTDDCNDNVGAINPNGTEVCNNGADDDCDTLVDDDDPSLDTTTWLTWYEDADADDLGNPAVSLEQCARPTDYVLTATDCDDTDAQVGVAPAWRLDTDADGVGAGVPLLQCDQPADHVLASAGTDCDDASPQVFPGQTEVCNGVDDDCDALTDDADPGLDTATADLYHPDSDGDGFGNQNVDLYRCVQPPSTVVDGTDCDDTRAGVKPGGLEVCDTLDNDCNTLIDDEDPNVDPSDFLVWFPDMDEDGYGELVGAVESCEPPPGYVDDGTDCNDLDATLGAPPLWYADADGDGHGVGLPQFGPSCTAPAGLAPGSVDEDCDDAAPLVNPSEVEVCEDGIDNDCDGIDLVCPLPEACHDYFTDAGAVSGVYTIEPVPYAGQYDVYCDMDTDFGGWTLVGSSFNRPLTDAGINYHADLSSLEPTQQVAGIWNGLAPVLENQVVDVRFACKEFVTDLDFTVDLVMYDVDWYNEFVTGNDAQSCFSEADGAGYDQVPERLDVLTGTVLPFGDDWNSGVLEGEDSCADTDFTIDFDDRGVDGDPNDGTDWGLANGVEKCGVSGAGEAWFLFVRAQSPN